MAPISWNKSAAKGKNGLASTALQGDSTVSERERGGGRSCEGVFAEH